MKHRYKVSGNVTAVIHTVIASDRELTEEEVYEQATREFAGISQFVGNGGCGERLVGVNGPYDEIYVDESPVFDDYEEVK